MFLIHWHFLRTNWLWSFPLVFFSVVLFGLIVPGVFHGTEQMLGCSLFFILCVSLVTYFIFRYLIDNVRKKAIISAYLSLLCAVSSILTWGAIRWIENPGNHPGSVLGKGGMDSDMRLSFWISVFSFHFLFLVFFILAYRFQKIQNLREKLKWE